MNTTLRLDHLNVRNFRCFAECEIDLHPDLTVLVADNGRGKTALLDAIRIALDPFVDAVSGTQQFARIEHTDVRLIPDVSGGMSAAEPTVLRAEGEVTGRLMKWQCSRNSASHGARSLHKTERLRDRSARLRDSAANESDLTALPLVAYYGTDRLWSEYRPIEKRRVRLMTGEGRMLGYTGSLSSSSSISSAVTWYRDQMMAARDSRSVALPSTARPERLLAAVREATRVVLDPAGWSELDWDFEQQRLVVGHPEQGRLPLSMMSDGIRTTIALVMDIARRCAILNPHLSEDAARQTPGIVLIDEVDLHLHPRWQQQVVDLLRQAFPSMQFVLSTHSPHVLSTIEVRSIRIISLREGEETVESLQQQTRGVESAAVLADVMDVDPIPDVEEAGWLSDYRALLQTGQHDSERGQHLWDRIIEHFGKVHPVIQEIETLRRLHDFKRTHHLPLSKDS